MNPEDLRAFANRDWELLAQSKAAAWSGKTPAERLQVASELYEFARRMKPDWPNERERAEDFAMHERVAELLSRVKLP